MLVYVDTSVVLAWVLAEDRSPPESLWDGSLITSRLTHYESWNRLHARNLAAASGDALAAALDRMAVVELTAHALARALAPFPQPVRTLDALHLASVEFLRGRGLPVALASYDERMVSVARLMGIDLAQV